MPRVTIQPKFRDVEPVKVRWSTFAKGLNTLVNATKIRDDELSVATNVILVDAGSPTRRPGTDYFGNSSGGTGTYGIYPYYKSDGTNKLLKLENGFLKVFNTATMNYDIISGGSFSSGVLTSGVMAFDTLYLSNGTNPLAKYNGSGLSLFSGINAPGSNWAVRGASLVSGPYVYSYRISAVNAVGETLAAAAATIATNVRRETWNPNPESLNSTFSLDLNWNVVTGAAGYNIYGVVNGDESYIDHVDGQSVSTYKDYGTITPSAFFELPSGDSTTGPKGKFIIEFKSSLIIAGDPNNPSRVYYSAGVDKVDSFLISDGGGYVDISKNSNDGDITGLAQYQNKAIIMKERSVWQLDFTESAIPAVSNISRDIGCVSHFTIQNVENDLFFLGRKIGGGAAIYVLGNEPNYLNVLRTNELSARVRPELQAIAPSNLEKTVAIYHDSKYIVFYGEGSSTVNNAAVIYDRERLGFTKWSSIYANFAVIYYNSTGTEYLLIADHNDGRITEISENYTEDKDSPILWNIKTKESDLKEPFLYKKYKWINLRLRNVGGTVRVKIWTDSTITAYTTSINATASSTVFRSARFRVNGFRRSTSTSSSSTSESANIIKRVPISRQGTSAIARSVAVEIYGEEAASKATLLDVEIEARPKSKNYYPRTEVLT